MPLFEATANALKKSQIDFSEDVNLTKRTYWRAGGSADGFCRPKHLKELQTLIRVCTETECPYFILGNGSNLLLSDYGLRGLVIQLSGDLASTQIHPDTPTQLTAGAGLKLNVLLARAAKNAWTGLECFAGIPGTIGGAVRMNAGATLGETKDCLIDVTVVLPDGTLKVLSQSNLKMSYRTAHLPPDSVIALARLQLNDTAIEKSQASIRKHLDHRKSTQPLHLPSCGSTFRNPPGDHAGRLIEAAHLKGFQIGQAQISPKHANFIVNLGGATADDIRAVLEHAQKVVLKQFGVQLVQEVHFVGDWQHWPSKTTLP